MNIRTRHILLLFTFFIIATSHKGIQSLSTSVVESRTDHYHGNCYYQKVSPKMSRVAVKYSKKLEENEMTIKRVTFSRLIEVSLSPSYQIISFSTEEFDLTKSGKGYLSGTVMH